MATRKKSYGEYGFSDLPANINTYAPYFDGWHVITNWKILEPSAGVYDFTSLEADMTILKDAGLNIGFTMWINPKVYLPNWLFKPPFSVPVPMVNIQNSSESYGYYFDNNDSFKTRLFLMLDALVDYLQTSPSQPNIIYLQSAEGVESRSKPYTGEPTMSKYKITDAEFLVWQKEVWAHLYEKMQNLDSEGDVNQFLDLVINAANSDEITDYVLSELPSAWLRKAGEGQDYGYNLEQFDWANIDEQNAVNITDPGRFRKRTDFNFTYTQRWFFSAYNMNIMQTALYMLTKGNDIWNIIEPADLSNLSSHATVSDLVNELSGNQSPVGANKVAWWAPVSKVDGADITRWPVSTYGTVLTNGANTSNVETDYVTKTNMNRLRKIAKVYNAKGTTGINDFTVVDEQFGSVPIDFRTDDKFKGDMGMKVRTAPLGKWLTQSNYVTDAKLYWRIGNVETDYWGRYAYGFIGTGAGQNKMFFSLHADYKINLNGINVSVIYFDEGNCQWGVRNRTGSFAATVTNVNSKTYKTLVVDINNFQSAGLTGGADLSLEYIAGNNTVKFVFLKIKKNVVANQLPIANSGANQTIIAPTSQATVNGSGSSDPDGSIAAYLWTQIGSTPAVATIVSETAVSSLITGMSANGDYTFQLEVTDNDGDKATDQVIIKRKASVGVNPPIANAGLDKTVIQPATTTTIGGTDTAGDNPIASRLWTHESGPGGSSITTPTTATTNITGLTALGTHVFKKLVSDNAGTPNTDSDLVNVSVVQAAAGIKYGAQISDKGLTTTEKISVTQNLGDNMICRTRVELDVYQGPAGEAFLLKARKEQMKVALNCNFRSVQTVGGEKIPNAYPTGANLTEYLTKLQDIIVNFKDVIEFVVVENEPINDIYYTGPIIDYIHQCQQAITVCHNEGVKIADGCVHVAHVLGAKAGGSLSANEQATLDVMNAYTNELSGLDYINIHSYIPPTTLSQWQTAVDFMRSKAPAGKKVISNEFGVHENVAGTVTSLLNQVRLLNFSYGIWFSGDGDGDSTPLNVLGTAALNPLGVAFRNTIA